MMETLDYAKDSRGIVQPKDMTRYMDVLAKRRERNERDTLTRKLTIVEKRLNTLEEKIRNLEQAVI